MPPLLSAITSFAFSNILIQLYQPQQPSFVTEEMTEEAREKIKSADIILHVLLSMSTDAVMSEELAVAGIMNILNNSSLQAFQLVHRVYTSVCTLYVLHEW